MSLIKHRKHENDLGNDKISKLILKLAIPSMLAQFVNVLYGIVDRIYIGNIPSIGGVALAGVGVCAPIITLITSFSFLVGLGGSPLVSMRLGEKRPQEAQKVISNSFFMLLVISVILTVVFLIIKKPMLMIFGASAKTITYANDYLTIYILGNIFALLTVGLNSFIICQGFSKVSMCTVLIGAVLNIALDPLFIFTFNMGVKGAAWATVLSQAVSCLWVIIFLLSKRSQVKLNIKNLSFKIMKKIMALGFSPFMIIATDSIVLILFNVILQKYGGIEFGDFYVTVATIVISYMQLITMPMGGITMGCQPILSYNYGAKKIDRVKKAFWGMNIICICFTSIMFIISMTIPHLFVGIFTSDAATLQLAVWAIRVYTSGIIFLAVQYACVDSLTALGQAKTAISLSLTRKMLIMTSLIIILPIFWGAKGTFFSEPIADILSAIISGSVCLFALNKILNKRLTLDSVLD
ncbi:MAG: MATE family efflux transporter [Clostridia bacterium]